MPKLNRARLAGIVYGSQSNPYKIDDLTYEYMGYNTIKILENGGGKTATIQLLTQPILPNQRIGERYFKDTVKHSERGHIVLEWTDDQRFIYTGFFFSMNRSSENPLDSYHMYVFESKASMLHELPLVKDGRPANWSVIRKHLKELDPAFHRTEWFDRSSESKEKHRRTLRRYNILQEEWERIVSINGDEGDAEEYFKKADTDQKLIEKILVPQIEQAMYATEEKRNQLTANFMRYRERIANIPHIRKSIENLELFQRKSENILSQAEDAEEKRTKAKRDVQAYEQGRVSLGVIYREKEERVQDYKERIREAEKKAKELQWKVNSHKLFLSKRKMECLERDIATAEGKVHEKIKEKEEAFQNRNKATAFYYDQKAEETERTIRDQQDKINLLDQQEPDIQKDLASSKKGLKTAWNQKENDYKQEESLMEEKIRGLDEEESQAEEVKEKANDELRDMRQLEKEAMAFFEERNNLYQEVLRITGEIAIDQPQKLLATIQNRIEKTRKDLQEAEERWNRERESYHQNREKVMNKHNDEEKEAQEHYNREQKQIETEASERISKAFEEQRLELERLKEETDHLIREASSERDEAIREMEQKSEETLEGKKQVRNNEIERAESQQKDTFARLEEDYQFRIDQHHATLRDLEEKHTKDAKALDENQKVVQSQSTLLRDHQEEKEKLEKAYDVSSIHENGGKRVRDAKEKAEKARVKQNHLLRELEPKEKTIQTIENKGHLPAHEDLVRVQEFLEGKGFEVTLGMERLQNMEIPEEANRYLVHALMIHEEEYEAVTRALSELGEWVESTPILFLTDETPETEGLMIFHPSSMDVFTSHEALHQFKEEVKKSVLALRKSYNEEIEKENENTALVHAFEAFFDRYPYERIKEAERLYKESEGRVRSLETFLEETRAHMKDLETSLRNLRENWGEQKEKAQQDKEDRIKAAHERHEKESKEERERLAEQRSRRNDQFNRAKERLEVSLYKKQEEARSLFEEEKRRAEYERDEQLDVLQEKERARQQEQKDALQKQLNELESLNEQERTNYETTKAALEPLLKEDQEKERALSSYIPYEEKTEKKQAERKKAEETIPSLEQRIIRETERKQQAKEKRNRAYEAKAELHQNIQRLEEDFKAFDLGNIDGSGEPLPYEDQKQRVQTLMDRLSQKQGDRESYLQVIRSQQSLHDQWMTYVDETGLSREWVRKNRIPVSEREMKDARVLFDTKRKELDHEEKERQNLHHALDVQEKGYESDLEHMIKGIGYEEPFLSFQPDFHEDERDSYEKERKYQNKMIRSHNERIDSENKEMTTIDYILSQPVRIDQQWLSGAEERLPDEAHRTLSGSIREGIQKREDRARESIKAFQRHLKDTAETFTRFKKQLEQENFQYHALVNQISTMISREYMASYSYIDGEFERIFEALEAKKENLELELKELKRNKETLADSCLSRARVVYSNIMSIPSQSAITSRGRQARMIDIKWRDWDYDEGLESMNDYIERKIHEMDILQKENGYTEDDIHELIGNHFRTVNLLNVLSPISEAQVKVIKPRKDENTIHGVLTERWRNVSSWSGGEKYSVYMVMFIILINHIRQSYQEINQSWKTILADNPFGKASSGHILKPIFEIAERNDVQFICLTAHKEEGIYKHFPVVYSLRLRHQFGTAFLTETKEKGGELQLQTAFYRKEDGRIPPMGEDLKSMDYETFKKQDQVSLFDED